MVHTGRILLLTTCLSLRQRAGPILLIHPHGLWSNTLKAAYYCLAQQQLAAA